MQGTVYRQRRFTQLYTLAGIDLPASVDEAHEILTGRATRRIPEREFEVCKRSEYARLATISVAHLYNLRHHQRLLNYTRMRLAAEPGGDQEPTAKLS